MLATAPKEAIHYPLADAAFQYRLAPAGPAKVRAETLDGAAIGFHHPTQDRTLAGSRQRVKERIRDLFPNAVEAPPAPVRHARRAEVATALPIRAGFVVKPRTVPAHIAARNPLDDVPAQIRAMPNFGTFRMVNGRMIDTEKGRALRERSRRRTGGVL